MTEQISAYLNQEKEGQKLTGEVVVEEKKDALKQQQVMRVAKGSAGQGGLLLLQTDKRKYVILCVGGGGIRPIMQRLAKTHQCSIIDGFVVSCPDEEIPTAAISCGRTTRCGIYPEKGIPAISVLPMGQSSPLVRFVREDNYVSDVDEVNIEIPNKDTTPTTGPMQEPRSKISIQPASHKNALFRVGMGMSRIVSTCYTAGKETIEMMLHNILPFMASTAALLGMTQVSGLGNFIVNSIAPLYVTLSGMLLISLTYSLPVIPPILGPGVIIAQAVGALLGIQIVPGNIPTQYVLPTLFTINAQADCDFIPVGLSLYQAKAETVGAGVPTVLYNHMTGGPLVVFIACLFSTGMYQEKERVIAKYGTKISGWGEYALEFLNEDCNLLIIFNEATSQELADISVLHAVAMLQEEPCVGDAVQIYGVSYTAMAIGLEVLHTSKELGHCCLSFLGSTQALCPGNIELKGSVLTENHLYKGGWLQIL